jgi:hypothetical protein
MNWPHDRSRLFADAYALRGAKGVPLLLGMGSFDLWHGSLGQMRGDSPAEAVISANEDANTERFLQTLALSRALDAVPQKCAEVVRLAYLKDGDKQIANALESEQCTERLLAVASAIYRELFSGDARAGDAADPCPLPDHVGTSTERK